MGRQERKGPGTSRQPPSQNPADRRHPRTPGPDRLITAAPRRFRRGTADTDQLNDRRHAMRTVGYITAVTMAAAAVALGLLAVMSLPDMRQYLKIRKM